MKFDFTAVDEHTATLHTIVGSMENNMNNMRQLKNELLSEFHGASAHGYQGVMDDFGKKLDAYQNALGVVKTKIAETSGSEGLMKVTDTNNGNRFMSIG